MPHDQNTSGFFITILRKTKEFDGTEEDIKQNPCTKPAKESL